MYRLKKILVTLGFSIISFASFSQARIVINGASNATIVETGGSLATPVYLDINNPNSNAITVSGGTGGRIISESEFNIVKWDIGTNTGTYTVPFYYTSQYLPVIIDIGAPGVGNGNIKFSTYHTPALNSSDMPSDVTNVTPYNLPGSPSNSDGSYTMADRFYILDANIGYTTAPTMANITFTYIRTGVANDVGLPNTLTEARLMAQRFNSASDIWSDWFGEGCTDAISGGIGTVQTGPVTPANMFRSWALWDNLTSLPLMVTHTNILCNASNTGTATATISGGSTPYTYSWSPGGQTNGTATGLSVGTYTVTVKDNTGCSSTLSVSISQPAALSVSITSFTGANCGGSTGSATASTPTGGTAPYTYNWTPSGGTNLIATTLSAGIYTITATDNSGCTATSAINIANWSVTTSVYSEVNCNGGTNGSIKINTFVGTSPPYTYSWSPGGITNNAATGLSAGAYTLTITDNSGCSTTSTSTITQPTVLTVGTAISSNVSCYGGVSGGAIATAGGGTPSYFYTWSDGKFGSTLTAIQAGTYTVTASDINGCSVTTSAAITQPTVLGITMGSYTNIPCSGGTGSATANAATGGTSPYTYSWSPGGGTNLTTSNLSAGAYKVYVTDNHGCTAYASVSITQPIVLAVAISSNTNVICNGGTATITGRAPTGGLSPYTYSWAPSGGSNLTVTNLTAGTYTLTTTDNHGCSATASATITEPASALAITIASQTNINCSGGKGGAIANAATGGTAPYTYSWTPSGGTSLTATNLAAGTYTITAKDNHGCTAITSVTITQPTLLAISMASHVNVSCNGGTGSATANTATGGTSPYTYSWTPSGGTNLTASNLSIGTYSITATDNHGCTAITSVTITQPTVLAITMASHVNVLCNGGTGSAIASAASGGTTPYTYSWAPSGGGNLAITGVTTGTYTITTTDNHGCTASASVNITQPVTLTASAGVNQNTTACASIGSASVTPAGGTLPYTYLWTPGNETTATATGLSKGSYTITVKDHDACSVVSGVTITSPSTLTGSAAVNNHTTECSNVGQATASQSGGASPYTYLWSPGGQTNAIATGLSKGAYTVTVKDNNNCSVIASVIITSPTILSASALINNHTSECVSTGKATASQTGGTSPYTYLWTPGGQTTAIATGLSAGSYTVTVNDYNGCGASATISITTPSGLNASAIVNNATTECANVGRATASQTGGLAPYAYVWTPSNKTGAAVTGLSAASYTVTINDHNGCTATASVSITSPTALSPNALINNHTTECANIGVATASPSGGTSPYTYLWAPGNKTTASATGLSKGSYTVTVRDHNDCSTSIIVTITAPSALSAGTVINSNTTECSSIGVATASPTGGVSPYTYSWTPSSQTNAAATGLSTGSYTVTVEDINGCTATAKATITDPAVLTASAIINSNTTECSNIGKMTAYQTGGTSPYTYLWSPGSQATLSATGLSAGSYTLTIEDHNGCSATASAIITTPAALNASAVVNSNTTECANVGRATASQTGGLASYAYVWTPSNKTGAAVTGLSAASYTVTITDHNGCKATTGITITQPAAFSASAAVNSNTTECSNIGHATAAPTGGVLPYTYLWTPGNYTSASATGLSKGSYIVTVKDNNGCSTIESITITAPAALITSMLVNNGTTECSSIGKATASPTGGVSPYTYLWSQGSQTNAAATGLSAGTYTVTIHDHNGCSVTANAIISEPAPIRILRDSTSVISACNGSAMVTATGGKIPYTYRWLPGGATTNAIRYQCAGIYCCKVTDNSGCVDSACIDVNMNILILTRKESDDSNKDNQNQNAIRVYPNPTRGIFTVSGLGNGQIVELYDYLGQKITSLVNDKTTSLELNISTEANGIYLIRITNKDGSIAGTKKIIKTE